MLFLQPCRISNSWWLSPFPGFLNPVPPPCGPGSLQQWRQSLTRWWALWFFLRAEVTGCGLWARISCPDACPCHSHLCLSRQQQSRAFPSVPRGLFFPFSHYMEKTDYPTFLPSSWKATISPILSPFCLSALQYLYPSAILRLLLDTREFFLGTLTILTHSKTALIKITRKLLSHDCISLVGVGSFPSRQETNIYPHNPKCCLHSQWVKRPCCVVGYAKTAPYSNPLNKGVLYNVLIKAMYEELY